MDRGAHNNCRRGVVARDKDCLNLTFSADFDKSKAAVEVDIFGEKNTFGLKTR